MLLNNIKIIVIIAALVFSSVGFAGDIIDDALKAVQLDNASALSEQLKRGLDVNYADSTGYSLLMLAARTGSKNSVNLLLANGAKVYQRNMYGDDALLLATFAGREDIVDLLLAKGAVAEANRDGWTPLHYAAFIGNLPLIERFIKLGIGVNAATANGLTPLSLAAMNGHDEAVRLLLRKGALNTRDSNGKDAVDHALSKGNTHIADLIRNSKR